MTRMQFSAAVLQSFDRFETYLASQGAIDEILKEADKPYVPGENRLSKMQVAWVTSTTVFRIHYSLFLMATGSLLYHVFSIRGYGLDLYVEAKRQATYLSMCFGNYLFRGNILIDVLNTYSHDAYEIYSHGPIDLKNLVFDEAVLTNLHPFYIDRQSYLRFDKMVGQCSGICDWMAYLYFKTEEGFSNPEHHLVSVVKQVSNGAGREAALWQIAQVGYPPICGLKKLCVADLTSPTTEKVQQLFERLRPGLYSVGTHGHRMNFAVTDEHTYLLEPNHGLIKDSPKHIAKLLTHREKLKRLKVCEISSTRPLA